MIWTTTPWTLAANLAVAVHPYLDYKALSYEKDGSKFVSVLVTERLGAAVAAGKLKEGQYSISEKTVRGSELEGLRYLHPFVENNPTDKDALKMARDLCILRRDTVLRIIYPGRNTSWQSIHR
jgi:isoleucyl-tRNA synthetase